MHTFIYDGQSYLIDALTAKVYRMKKDGTAGAQIAITGGGKAIAILRAFNKSRA